MYLELLFILVTFATKVKSIYHVQAPSKEDCSCHCSGFDGTLCQKLTRFEKELTTVKDVIEHRTQFIVEIREMKEKLNWQEYLLETLSKQVESFNFLIPESPDALVLQPLTMKPENRMQSDSAGENTHLADNSVDLMRNVSDLLAKVEVVENMTMEVQEELKSERRVRRHIEEDLSEARSSIKDLGDKFLNFSVPADISPAEVEEIIFAAIESLNKTFFEDHLQKLYYKVDGVVYKNETKKLDERLENVETELLSGTNTSTIQKLVGDLRNVTEALNILNDTVNEKLESENLRLELIEAKSNKLNETESLVEQVGKLMNASDLVQSGVSDLWNDIQDVRNYSSYLQNEFESRIAQIENDTVTVIHEELKNLSSEVVALKFNLSHTQESVSNVEKDVRVLAADVAITENKVHDINYLIDSRFSDVDAKLDNMTEGWIRALDNKTKEIPMQNSNKFEEITMPQRQVELFNSSEDTENEVNYYTTANEDDDINYIIGVKDKVEYVYCSLPKNNDTHLLVTMKNYENGKQYLAFACSPIGQYALREGPIPVSCENGKWVGSLPACEKLLSEEEINSLADELKSKSPCSKSPFARDFPDPTDCSRFFKCWNGKTERLRCPARLHFNPVSRQCHTPEVSKCTLFNTPETKTLKDLIPTILVDPDNVDKPYGLMGTSSEGHLVVYLGTSFKLHCLYPENMWGIPEWHSDTLSAKPYSSLIMSTKSARNRLTVSVMVPTKENSGVYTCITPFGKQLSVTVIVEDVICPEMDLVAFTNRDVYYRPHPEGMYRVLSTVAQFQCEGGRTISATCLSDGEWSRSPPTEEECPTQTHSNLKMPWSCPHIDTSGSPDLFLEPFEGSKVVSFKCAGNTRLIGNPFSRCTEEGSWSHSRLPTCIPR